MKNKLLFRKAVTQLFFSLCLMLCCANSSWGQQVIGSYPVMDGGFEGQTVAALPLTAVAPAVNTTWAYGTSGTAAISNTGSGTTGPRTGSKYAVVSVNTTAIGRQLISPSATTTITSGSYVVQYYTRNATASMNGIPVGIGTVGNSYAGNGKNTTTTWAKVTQVVTSSATDLSSSVVAFRTKLSASQTSGGFDVDDVVVYAGTAADGDAPLAASGGAVSGLDVSWTASSDVDGGGYMVVRYASNPNPDNDPNQNGIYAKNLSITNGTNGVSNPGTVVYIGTGTSFTDDVAGSSSGTDYYKIYTVDKAFNYSAELIATAVVSSTPAITSSTETLTGFNYTGTGPSASQSFVVTGSNLTANLVVSTASTNFELSSDDFATAGAASITLTGTTVASTTLYVRLKASLTGGLKTATVTITSTGANALPTLSLSGSVQAVYYYDGSGLLSSNTSWGANSNGTGANPTAVTDAYANFVIANGNATTNASWTLDSNSKLIVGNGSAVSLTVADTFPIIGTIDAAANGSVVWQHVAASPTFGTLNNDSEVHFAPAAAASYSFGATTAYGKLFIDGAGVVSVSNTASTPTVKTALTVASGSTLSFTSNNNPTISINATATATINGKVITFKATGLFASTGSIPLIGAATLVLGATSTIEFGRPGSAQAVTGLPVGVSYANLILSDGGSSSAAAKTIAAPFTVNGTLTINLATPAFSTISGANNITMANGATVVMTSGVLGAIPSFASGSKFNVTYNGNGKTQIVGATTASSTNVTLTSANPAIVAGMTVTGTAIPAGTTVASISGTALVLSAAATATSATPTLTFGTAVPQTTGVDLPTVASNALGDLTFDNTAGVVLSSAVKANNIITAKSNTITLNTADFLDASVQMNAGSELTLNVNASQANLKQIVFSGATGTTSATTAKLKLNMTADTQVTFANSSAQNWGTGTIEITGFQEGKIKFGSSNSALTATQLGLIINTADLTKTFKLSDQGYLYYSTTLVPGDDIVVTSANPVFLAVGVVSSYSITATNSPTSFVLADPTNDPLPAGLTLNATTGAIEGTPTVSVTNFVVAITISNSVNTTNTIDFTFNVTTRDPQTIRWSQDFPATNTYGDAGIALTATTDAPALSVSYSSSNTAVATISGSTLTIVGPGTTTITASQAGNANYSPATNLTKELVVNTKVLTISGAVVSGKIYDKTTTAAITGTLAGGLVGADVVTLVLSGTFADANAGIDKPVTSTSTLTGADAAKYSLTQPSGLTATITKADQLLAALGTSSFKILGDADYDPIPLVTDSNVTLLPSVPVENPNFTYTSSNESVATIVGGKVHIVGLGSTTITGEQAGSINYNASLPVSQTLKVLPAPLAAWDLYSFNPTAGQQSVTSVNASEVAAGISVTPSLSMGSMAIITNAGNRYRFTSSDWPYAISSGTVAPINIATGKYMSVAIAADSGKSLSLSSINASFRGGAISSELLSQFAYSIDNGVTFTAIGSPTTFAGASGTRFYSDIDLSGIAALQNLPAGTTVTLRYYASGKSNVTSSTAGQKAWGFFSDFVENNTRALIIGGTVVTVAPTASAQIFCASATVASLTATGTAIKWYAAATGGSALASDAVLASGNYYASQTLNGSESTRTAVAVTIQAAPNAGTNGTLSLIASPSDADLFTALTGADAGGSWTRPSSGYVGVYTYTVNAISPCTVNATSTVTVSVSTLLPAADTTYNLCAGAKISNLLAAATASNGSVGVKVYAAATGGSPIVLSGTTDAVIPTSTTPRAYWLTEPASTPSGESARVRVFAVVNALPATPGTITGTAAICNVVGSTTELTYSIAAVTGATSYVWTVPTGANILSGQGSTSVTVNFAGVAQGITALTLGVRSENATGCLSVAKTLSLTRVLPVAPASVTLTNPASATPATAITAVGPFIGTTTELTLTAAVTASANSYSWTLPAGVNVISGNPATDRVLVINFANAASGTTSITASVVSVSGCGNSIAKALVLTKVLPAKPAAITTTQTNVCLIAGSESTVTYTVVPVVGAFANGYTWTVPTGASIVGSATGNSIVVSYSSNFNAAGSVTVTSSNGVGTSATAATLAVAATAPLVPATLVMTLAPSTTAVVAAGPFMGTSTVLTLTAAPVAGAVSYAWTLPAGVNQVSGGTERIITVNFPDVVTPTGITALTISVKAVNGCGLQSAAKALSLTRALPAKPAAITTTQTNVCLIAGSESTVTYTVAPVAGAFAYGYTWTVPTGASIVGTATGNSIVVSYSSNFNAAGSVTVTSSNGVGTSATAATLAVAATAPLVPATLVMTLAPSTTAVVAAGPFIGTSTVLTLTAAPVAGAVSYAWTLPAGVNQLSGGTERIITVNFADVVTPTGITALAISVKAVNGCGLQSVAKALSLTRALPVKPAAITTTLANVCSIAGTNATVTYSVAQVAGAFANGYAWTVPTGGTIVSGQGTTSIAVSYAGNFTAGNVSVTSSNGVGTSLTPTTLAVARTSGAVTPATIVGQVAGLCAGTAYNYSFAAGANAQTYTITGPVGSVVTSADNASNTTNTITTSNTAFTVVYPTTAIVNISIVATNPCGSSAAKTYVVSKAMGAITAISGPTAVDTCSEYTYTASAVVGALAYTWTVPSGAQIVSGQGTNTLVVVFPGTLATGAVLKVLATNACSVSSALKSSTVLTRTACTSAREEVVLQGVTKAPFAVKAYPNPYTETFNLSLSTSSEDKVSVVVYDMTGRLIERREVRPSDMVEQQIGDRYPSGVYNVVVTQGEEVKTLRVIKR